jgi:excisionase family DNA binding protein
MENRNLSIKETAKILGITRKTLLKWIDNGRIMASFYPISGRQYTAFDPVEVAKVKKRMIENPKPGVSLLKK